MRTALLILLVAGCARPGPTPETPAPEEVPPWNPEIELGVRDAEEALYEAEPVEEPEYDTGIGPVEAEYVPEIDAAIDKLAILEEQRLARLERIRTATRGGCARSEEAYPAIVATSDGGESAWDVSCLLDISAEDLDRCPCVVPRPRQNRELCTDLGAIGEELQVELDALSEAWSEAGTSVELTAPVLCLGGSGQ